MIAPRATAPRFGLWVGTATALAVAGAAVLTGCAAGQQAQTLEVKGANDGTNGAVGNIAVRAVGLLAPTSGNSYGPGSSAPLQVVIVNVSGRSDTLTSVSSPAFTGWSSGPMSASSALPMSSQSSIGASPAATPASTSGSSGGTQRVPIPGNSRVSYGVPDATSTLTVSGIKHRLYPGQAIPIKFTFARAGSTTVQAPVQLTSTPGSAVIGTATSSPAGGGDVSEPPTAPHTPEPTSTKTS